MDSLLDRPDAVLMRWKVDVPRDDVYKKLKVLLEGEQDLLERLPAVWHGWDYEMQEGFASKRGGLE